MFFVGDDWYNRDDWNILGSMLEKINSKIIYLPRTPNISTTKLKDDYKKILIYL